MEEVGLIMAGSIYPESRVVELTTDGGKNWVHLASIPWGRPTELEITSPCVVILGTSIISYGWANILLCNCQHFNCSTSYLISCHKFVINASSCGHPSIAVIKLSSSTPFQTITQYSLLVVLMVSELIAQAIAPPIFSTSPLRHGLKDPTWPTVDIITHAVWSLMRLQEIERLLWLGVGMNSVRVAADIFKMWRFSIWILSSGGMVSRKWRTMPPAAWYGI